MKHTAKTIVKQFSYMIAQTDAKTEHALLHARRIALENAAAMMAAAAHALVLAKPARPVHTGNVFKHKHHQAGSHHKIRANHLLKHKTRQQLQPVYLAGSVKIVTRMDFKPLIVVGLVSRLANMIAVADSVKHIISQLLQTIYF